MRLDHQYEVTIVCHIPRSPIISMMRDEPDPVAFVVRGDYETVSKALGATGSDARNQLDRFEQSLNASDTSPHAAG